VRVLFTVFTFHLGQSSFLAQPAPAFETKCHLCHSVSKLQSPCMLVQVLFKAAYSSQALHPLSSWPIHRETAGWLTIVVDFLTTQSSDGLA